MLCVGALGGGDFCNPTWKPFQNNCLQESECQPSQGEPLNYGYRAERILFLVKERLLLAVIPKMLQITWGYEKHLYLWYLFLCPLLTRLL